MSMCCAVSRVCGSRIKMPRCAAMPVPATMAMGVAKPRAQGQAITSTATAWIKATSAAAPHHHQAKPVTTAMASTVGTNTAATWSTKRCMGALWACASSTMRMMWANTESAPDAATRITKRPLPLMLPPVTRSCGPLLTGSGSPVSSDSSACECPSSTTPSAGMRSPGSTDKWSPTSTSARSMSCSPSGPNQCACSGRRACKARIASVVLRLTRASIHLPSSTRVMTTAALSKYTCGSWPAGAAHHRPTDKAQPAVVPRATSKSMLPLPALMAYQAAR